MVKPGLSVDATSQVDRSWRSLFRVGGFCGLIIVVPYLLAIVAVSVAPPPLNASGEDTLTYIRSHRWLYIGEQVLWLAPGVLAMVVLLACAVAVARLDKGFALIAGVIAVSAWALTLALPTTGGGSPVLVYLSDQYAAATTNQQRQAYATVAEGLIASNNTPNIIGVLTTVGILLVSLIMLKGVFPRWLAILGIATGTIGVISETLRPVIGSGYAVYGLLLLVWFATVGWQLIRLARSTT